jgi:hypothetical protein
MSMNPLNDAVKDLPTKVKNVLLSFLLFVLFYYFLPTVWPPRIIAPLQAQVNVLQTRQDHSDGRLDRIERFNCYKDYTTAILAGSDCQSLTGDLDERK